MRIGIDARLNAYRRGGIPEYTRQLLAALAPLTDETVFLALQHYKHRQPIINAPNVRRVPLFTPPHHRLEQWALPVELLPHRLDVIHCPDFIAPQRRLCAAVVTIHDLAFLHYPEILDKDAQPYYAQVRDSVWHADAVIAVSEATRRDITHLLGLPHERIDRVYEAAAPLFTPQPIAAGSIRSINQQQVTASTFALFVSTLEPRKNLPTLLHALRVCCDRQPDVPYHLVVAGARGWHYNNIFVTVRDLRLADRVTFLGNVIPEDLYWLYNACILYTNPSLYEGFGLPVLEALACGAPTIAAQTSSIPEVAGDAALLVPPRDVTAWAETIERVWNDQDQQQTLAQRGPVQAARFSWQQAAQETLAIYRRISPA